MTVMEAKRELTNLLNKCDKQVHEIDVIHGCHGGTALLNFVRKEFSHPRLVKRILTLNNGMTTLVIKP
jgi:DNA-nicking Smr family endonuclease